MWQKKLLWFTSRWWQLAMTLYAVQNEDGTSSGGRKHPLR